MSTVCPASENRLAASASLHTLYCNAQIVSGYKTFSLFSARAFHSGDGELTATQLPASWPVLFEDSIPGNSEANQVPHNAVWFLPCKKTGTCKSLLRDCTGLGWLLSSSKVSDHPCCKSHRFARCLSNLLTALYLWMEILAEVCWQGHVGDFPVTWGVFWLEAGLGAHVTESPAEEKKLGDVDPSSGHTPLAKVKHEPKAIRNLNKQIKVSASSLPVSNITHYHLFLCRRLTCPLFLSTSISPCRKC